MKKSKTKIAALCACCLSLTFALSACGAPANYRTFDGFSINSVAQTPINFGQGVLPEPGETNLPSANDGLVIVAKTIESTTYYGVFCIATKTMVFEPSAEKNVVDSKNISILRQDAGTFDYFKVKDASNKVRVFSSTGLDITKTITGQDTVDEIDCLSMKTANVTIERWSYNIDAMEYSKYFKTTGPNSRISYSPEAAVGPLETPLIFATPTPTLAAEIADWKVKLSKSATNTCLQFYNSNGQKASEITVDESKILNPEYVIDIATGDEETTTPETTAPLFMGTSVYYQYITKVAPDTQDPNSYNWVFGEAKYMVTLHQFDIKTGQSTQHNLNSLLMMQYDDFETFDNEHVGIVGMKLENKEIVMPDPADPLQAANLYMLSPSGITEVADKAFFMKRFATIRIAGNKFLATDMDKVYGVLDANFNVITKFDSFWDDNPTTDDGIEFALSAKAFVYKNSENKSSFIDLTGKALTPPKYDSLVTPFLNGYMIAEVHSTADGKNITKTYAVSENGVEKEIGTCEEDIATSAKTYTFQGQPCEQFTANTYSIKVITKQVTNASTTYTGATYNFAGTKLFERAGYATAEQASHQNIVPYAELTLKALFTCEALDGTYEVRTVNITGEFYI